MSKKANTDAFVVEMIRRTREMRQAERVARWTPKLPKHEFSINQDMNMFEAACDALRNSKMAPENGFVIEAAPGFAALLIRVAEQTAAEFGPEAAANAFRWIAEEMREA